MCIFFDWFSEVFFCVLLNIKLSVFEYYSVLIDDEVFYEVKKEYEWFCIVEREIVN